MMNIQTVEKEIGDLRITTTTFPAMHSTLMLARLVKAVGGALGGLLKLDPESQLEAVGSEIAAAFSTLSPKEVVELIPDILASTTALIDGKQIDLGKKTGIDQVFTGRLRLMFQVVGFVLGVNYRDFTNGESDSAANALAK